MFTFIKPKILLSLVIGITLYFSLLNLFYHFEFGLPGSTVRNFGDVLWWSIATIATVGYGDVVPISDEGRAIGYVFLFLSVSVFAYSIGKVSTTIKAYYDNKKMGFYGTNFTGHTVIIGWNDFGHRVVDQLIKAEKKVAIVSENRDHVDQIYLLFNPKNVFILYANCNNYEFMTKVNIHQSSMVFINNGTDTEKLLHLLQLKSRFEGLEYIVNIDNADLKVNFQREGARYVISADELASKLMASYIFEPDVANFNEEIISFSDSDENYDVKQFKVLEENPYVNWEYIKVFFDLKKKHKCILIGISKEINGKQVLMKNPADDVPVSPGNYLLLITDLQGSEKLSRFFKVKEGIIPE